VLVCGSRNWKAYGKVKERLALLPKDCTIIEGGAPGADLIARLAAMELGLDVVEVPANWTRYGKAAGPIRNDRMLKFKPHLVIAFHENIDASRGTKDTVTKARNLGIPTEVIT
jgi:hypothetical protein